MVQQRLIKGNQQMIFNTEDTTGTLRNRLANLHLGERTIFYIMAIDSEIETVNEIRDILISADFKKTPHSSLIRDINLVLAKLLKLELIRENYWYGRYRCEKDYVDAAMRMAVEDGVFSNLVFAIQKKHPLDSVYNRYRTVPNVRIHRDIKIAILLKRLSQANNLFKDKGDLADDKREIADLTPRLIYVSLFNAPFDWEFLCQWPHWFVVDVLTAILNDSIIHMKDVSQALFHAFNICCQWYKIPQFLPGSLQEFAALINNESSSSSTFGPIQGKPANNPESQKFSRDLLKTEPQLANGVNRLLCEVIHHLCVRGGLGLAKNFSQVALSHAAEIPPQVVEPYYPGHEVAHPQVMIIEAIEGELHFFGGEYAEALVHLDNANAAYQRATRKRKKVCLPGLFGPIHMMTLLSCQGLTNMTMAITMGRVDTPADEEFNIVTGAISVTVNRLLELPGVGGFELYRHSGVLNILEPNFSLPLEAFLRIIVGNCLGAEFFDDELEIVEELMALVHKNGYRWAAAELSALLISLGALDGQTGEKLENWKAKAKAKAKGNDQGGGRGKERGEAGANGSAPKAEIHLIKGLGYKLMCSPDSAPEPWEKILNALSSIASATARQPDQADGKDDNKSFRLTWRCKKTNVEPGLYITGAYEQKRRPNGQWTLGRPISFERLYNRSSRPDYLTDQDSAACDTILATYSGWGRNCLYELKDDSLRSLVNHPHLYSSEDPTAQVELLNGRPEIRLVPNGRRRGRAKEEGDSTELRLEFWPKEVFVEERMLGCSDLMVVQENPTQFRLYQLTKEQQKIGTIIGGDGFAIPGGGREKVLQVISELASVMPVQSSVGSLGGGVEEVDADSRMVAQLQRGADGLEVRLRVRPFGATGPVCMPGVGGTTIVTMVDGRPIQTTRNLAEEKAAAARLLEGCPYLASAESESLGASSGSGVGAGDGWQWNVDGLEAALEVLLSLENMGEQVLMEWPAHEPIRILPYTSGLNNFHISLQAVDNWFQVSGELRVDEDTVLEMHELLKLIEGARSSRFIRLNSGQFLALTAELRKRLGDIQGCLQRSSKGPKNAASISMLLSPAAVPVMLPLTQGLGSVSSSRDWKQFVKRVETAWALNPELPSVFRGELRDYQMEGFTWLARLAHLGMGACLADDMGLGKTIQALALLLMRAEQGPALVVAPTSVCSNWEAEMGRFTPSLHPVYLGTGGNGITTKTRQEVVSELGPFSVLLCSYGLLQQEENARLLADMKWNTIVLDEAQAIKNMHTKRSQAAMGLQGDFKIVTTGTPIENHLGELWNLFQFILPGLLGSHDDFNTRFAVPIEKNRDRQARADLKHLITPFILRRTKNQVLTELPPRTDIVLSVEMNDQEAGMYEALRREAITKLEAETGGPEGQKHIRILAELTRLRRFCCHPDLVVPEAGVTSSKLQVLSELVDELRSNNHKALVFSQFVDHLAKVRALLDEQGITYQYLDGSTPAAERKRQVEQFQGGHGDLFLISLKAGGTGLNLTAADYVIHLDPWWNPAVEDQASDRAHRIGQARPVTVYRLVTKGTIEERVVGLHHHKRFLADSLLQEADVSARLNSADLLAMISQK